MMKDEEEAEVAAELPNKVEVPADFWEDEKFDNVGKIAGIFSFIIAGLVVLVGVFASGQYNDGAAPVDFQAAESQPIISEAIRVAFEAKGRGDL